MVTVFPQNTCLAYSRVLTYCSSQKGLRSCLGSQCKPELLCFYESTNAKGKHSLLFHPNAVVTRQQQSLRSYTAYKNIMWATHIVVSFPYYNPGACKDFLSLCYTCRQQLPFPPRAQRVLLAGPALCHGKKEPQVESTRGWMASKPLK